ncbi:hypothetical protein K8Q98_00410 [Candidatus Nomurabacteria bacterium]|nr:hypothetical protein [Candidatus Nomurabacteria bacterium]
MNKIFYIFIIFIILIFGIFTITTPVLAATISFSAPENASIGDEFSLGVLINSADKGFNAAEGNIVFPSDLLEVVSIDTTPSATVFNFWLSLPSFSNELGSISFSGGTTSGIAGSATQVLSVRVRAKGSGSALITASDASINASDGSGSNILEKIDSKFITINQAVVVVPVKPKPVLPQTQPIKQVEVKQEKPAEKKPSTMLFTDRGLRFPQILSVTPVLHKQVGADLFISGIALEGTHVHLALHREGIPYKEIVAIVNSTLAWEGAMTNIFAYGTYTLTAWSENINNNQKSSIITWEPIKIYPPFSIHYFGDRFLLPWYAATTALIGILVGILGVFLLWRYVIRREPYQTRFVKIALLISIFAFIGMFATSYIIWQREYRSEATFWEDTEVPCILRAPSYIDVFSSAQLSIYVDGKLQQIPIEVGFSPKCVAQVHTHDDTGNLHFERTERPITLADFFAVAEISLSQKGYTLSITINGEDYTDRVDSYGLQNGDVIVVKYSTL